MKVKSDHRSKFANPVEAIIFSGFFLPIASIGKFTAMITLYFHLDKPQNKYEFHNVRKVE